MFKEILITMIDGEKLIIDDDTFLTCIENDNNALSQDNMFYSKIIYQDYPLNESNSLASAQTTSPLVGIMGLFASSDFFMFSDNIDASNTIVYKTSAIKSISFN